MNERKSKLFGLFVFLILISGIFYVMITGSKANVKESYNQIALTGNVLLQANEYLLYARLNDSTKYDELTLLDVKTKLEKHPYLRKAEVEFDGVTKILVEVEENEIKAVLLHKNELKLVTNDLKTLPLFPPINIQDLPVITNLKMNGKGSFNNRDLKSAFRIIDAISVTDESVRKNLAEINLRNGGDVILTFTGLKFPVLFGRSDEVKKALILKNLWQQILNDEKLYEEIEYIDLRYKNKVFIGKRKSELLNG